MNRNPQSPEGSARLLLTWYDLEPSERRQVLHELQARRRQKIFVPFVILVVIGAAAFFAYALQHSGRRYLVQLPWSQCDIVLLEGVSPRCIETPSLKAHAPVRLPIVRRLPEPLPGTPIEAALQEFAGDGSQVVREREAVLSGGAVRDADRGWSSSSLVESPTPLPSITPMTRGTPSLGRPGAQPSASEAGGAVDAGLDADAVVLTSPSADVDATTHDGDGLADADGNPEENQDGGIDGEAGSRDDASAATGSARLDQDPSDEEARPATETSPLSR